LVVSRIVLIRYDLNFAIQRLPWQATRRWPGVNRGGQGAGTRRCAAKIQYQDKIPGKPYRKKSPNRNAESKPDPSRLHTFAHASHPLRLSEVQRTQALILRFGRSADPITSRRAARRRPGLGPRRSPRNPEDCSKPLLRPVARCAMRDERLLLCLPLPSARNRSGKIPWCRWRVLASSRSSRWRR